MPSPRFPSGLRARAAAGRTTAVALLVGALTAPAAAQSDVSDDGLFDAVLRRDTEGVVAAIGQGADVNATRSDGSTPLHWAALRDDGATAGALLDAGAHPDPTDENGETPLLLAASVGNLTIARRLVESGADLEARRWSGDTPLLAAVRGGNQELVRLLLNRGADPNVAEARMGQTPLMRAIAEGHAPMARLLIARGADVEAVSHHGSRPIHFAARHGRPDSVAALLSAGANAHVPVDGATPFLLALAAGSGGAVRQLLDEDVDVNARDLRGGTPLHEAVRQGLVDVAAELVRRGADLEARTAGGDERDGPPGRRSEGLTPFLVAAQVGHVPMLQRLRTLGAEPAVRAADGAGAVLLATRGRSLEAVAYLVELGLDVNHRPDGRPGALHTAIRLGEDEIVTLLAAHGADFSARDQHGRNALEEAEFEAPTHTIELVRQLVANLQN